MAKNCLRCEKEFEGNRKQMFCSDECSKIFAESPTPLPNEMLEHCVTKTQMGVSKKGLEIKPSAEVNTKVRDIMDKINKDFGAGTVMRLGDKPQVKLDIISTGSLGLDLALGVGGLPRGRMVEIYGWESSGKTTIALQTIAEAQKLGLKCGFIDAENSFDPEYADALGVNIDDMFICQPTSGEEGLEVADRMIESGQFGVMVIDSVAALVPKAELEGQIGDSKMGLHARLMSQACRKMTGSIHRTNCLCIFINQIRHKIGVVYGSPETRPGGNALQFYASVILKVKKEAQIKDGEISIGNKTKVTVSKNKCAAPFKFAEFDINFGKGVYKIGEILDIAVSFNIVQKAGSWYSYNGQKLGQGRDAVCELLEDNQGIADEIEEKIRQIANN